MGKPIAIAPTDVRDTAFRNLHKPTAKQQQVLGAIKVIYPCTTKEVADFLRKPVQEVVGRVHELRDEKVLIKIVGKVIGDKNRPEVKYAPFNEVEDRRIAIEERRIDLNAKREELVMDYKNCKSEETKTMLNKEIGKITRNIQKIEAL